MSHEKASFSCCYNWIFYQSSCLIYVIESQTRYINISIWEDSIKKKKVWEDEFCYSVLQCKIMNYMSHE